MNDNEELRREARKRLKARSGFWSYIGVWGAVSLLLTAIWFIATPGEYFWPVWAIFGMGVAALFVGLDAYGPGRRYHTEADVDAEIERMTGHPISQNPPHRDDPTL
ncbi:2TM domain-containing protein [Cryobacterium sp. CG_9.6]|uniref:2TM domain-containing protein n=1 Tax=Cryobacterium sp. CG_9.6 TaxID=2760710 RepID=UPI00247646C3|nr:2TM domain-containing protein [Cryobacterium sp. CG_9.6]MDH6236796.1 putative membrane protein [Cryobacterium sp. CG_9.6]